MGTRETARDRGNRQARQVLQRMAAELRDARLLAGVSQAQVARVAGLSQPWVSRAERVSGPSPRVDELARHAAALGLRLTINVYPEGEPVRDAGQLRLLRRFRSRLPANLPWRTEVPVAGRGDLRAWDMVLDADRLVAVDAETRLHDIQALQRRCETKLRDSRLDCLVLVVAETAHNADVLGAHRHSLRSTFPDDTAEVMRALRAGRAPRASGIVVL